MNKFLIAAGWLTLGVGLLHFAMIFIGAPAYRYFGAGEKMALADTAGEIWPAMLTLGLVAMFVLWALYAFAGAGQIRKLPLLQPILITIGTVFTLRGLLVFFELYLYATNQLLPLGTRGIAFSAVSLSIGLCYLLGAWHRFNHPSTSAG